MTFRTLWFGIIAGTCAVGAAAPSLKVEVRNPSPDNWTDAPVVVKVAEGDWSTSSAVVARCGEQLVFVQPDDMDGNGKVDELCFLVDLKAGETRTFAIESASAPAKVEPRAHVGMFLPTAKIKGMEGPGWESDRIAYRLYWDERNPVDVFAKTQPILSLDQFAAKGHDYHVHSKWGQDVLKVGTALGCGGFGAYINDKVEKVSYVGKRDYRILADGPIRAAIDLKYTDWETSSRKLNMTCRMSIFAGQSWAEAALKMQAVDGKPLPEFVTGIVRHEDTTLVEDTNLGTLGRWGKQALGDKEVPKQANLGLGVVCKPSEIVAYGEDKVNNFIRLKSDGAVSYRYMANWEKQPDAAKSAEEFGEMLKRVARLHPEVKVSK